MATVRTLFSSPRTPIGSPRTHGSPISPGTPNGSPGTPSKRISSIGTPTSSPGSPVIVMGTTSQVPTETLAMWSKHESYPRLCFAFNTQRYVHDVGTQKAIRLFWRKVEQQCEDEEALFLKKKKRKC